MVKKRCTVFYGEFENEKKDEKDFCPSGAGI